jgi:predicted TIM-barrel fold metal-dependent hydrolase
MWFPRVLGEGKEGRLGPGIWRRGIPRPRAGTRVSVSYSTVPRIDAHAHLVPDAYRAELLRRNVFAQPIPPWSPEIMLAFMHRHQIDATVVSVAPLGVYFGDQALARELARVCNEATAELVRSAPARFAGLAVLPLPDVDDALAELTDSLDRLHLDGVILLSNSAGTYLGDPAWDPLMAELDQRGAYVFVHPIQPTTSPLPSIPAWVQEYPFDTTRAVVSMIYNGTLERFPHMKIQLAHLGGAVPFLGHRIAELASREPVRAQTAPQGALAYLARLYYDTGLSNNIPALAATREVAGVGHLLFGTDWPFAGNLPAEGDPSPDLDWLGTEGRLSVEGLNVGSLVPRLVDALERRF